MLNPKGRILCPEDDPDTRDLIVFVLSDYGLMLLALTTRRSYGIS